MPVKLRNLENGVCRSRPCHGLSTDCRLLMSHVSAVLYVVAKAAQKPSEAHATENIDMRHLYSPDTQYVLPRVRFYIAVQFHGIVCQLVEVYETKLCTLSFSDLHSRSSGILILRYVACVYSYTAMPVPIVGGTLGTFRNLATFS